MKYRVLITKGLEHIDFWDYKKGEIELAKARYNSITLGENERKFLIDLETLEYLL